MSEGARSAGPWWPVVVGLAAFGLLRFALIGWGLAIGARATGTTAGQVALVVDTIMAVEVLVAALLAGWPKLRNVAVAWIVAVFATLTAVVGTVVWAVLGPSTAHADPSAWASQVGRIIIAAGIGLLIAAICGWRPQRRAGAAAPRG
ncbi:hypothetical protein WEI85_00770 [Actinomycetes bacterium KLBMP 9797]